MKVYLTGCLLTVLIEGMVFLMARYRHADFLAMLVFVNAATNLSLNLFLHETGLYHWTLFLEVFLWLLEYLVYGLYDGFDRKKLIVTVLANLCSFLFGLLLYPGMRDLIF